MVALLSRQKKIFMVVLVVATVTLLMSALGSMWLSNINDVRLPSVDTIRTSGIKAYWDAELTNETTEIPWGRLSPGSVSNVTLYLRNISNIQITLNMTAANWVFRSSTNGIVFGPANSTEYMNLTWSYNDSILNLGQTIQTRLTLQAQDTTSFVEFVIANDVQQFSFDINMKAIVD